MKNRADSKQYKRYRRLTQMTQDAIALNFTENFLFLHWANDIRSINKMYRIRIDADILCRL